MRLFLGALLVLLCIDNARAQNFYLVCRYERTVEADGKSGPTTGEMSVHIQFVRPIGQANNVVIRTSKAPCYEFIGNGDDMRIEGACERVLQLNRPTRMSKDLTIDRVSGAFEEIYRLGESGGLVHYGRCSVTSKLF